MTFIDEVKIYVKAGNGGDGALGFRREKFIEFGGPDGGDGGKGGNIIVRSSSVLQTLFDFRYHRHFKAKNGQAGKGNCATGISGDDLILMVPVGTQILTEDKSVIIADFIVNNESCVIAAGGRGGLGNYRFKSSTNRAPRKITLGENGDELTVILQLKLLSDIGIIGLPNAGKSSFLSAISAARPRIADYPFTTLSPQLGVARRHNRCFVFADIPGLIEGAHQNKGLGDRFLRHVERCNVLLHIIDASLDVTEAYNVVMQELAHYDNIHRDETHINKSFSKLIHDKLEKKLQIIVLNKTDLLNDAEVQQKIMELRRTANKSVFNNNADDIIITTCSAATRYGIDDVVDQVVKLLDAVSNAKNITKNCI